MSRKLHGGTNATVTVGYYLDGFCWLPRDEVRKLCYTFNVNV